MFRKHFYWIFISSSLLFSACRPDEVPPTVYEVPALIQPYIDLFEQEAAKRGVQLDITNLKVEFEEDLNGGDAAGTCTFATEESPTPHIRLDTTSFNWRNNEYHREILVFHELGHCILDRLHKDDLLPNGNIASIMRSTGEQVYGGLLNDFKREYYLDELFNPSAPAPDWAENAPAYSEVGQKQAIFTDEFSSNIKRWNLGSSDQSRAEIIDGSFQFESKSENTAFFTSKSIFIDTDKDFEIEASVKIVKGTSSSMIQWGGSGSSDFFFYGFNQDSAIFAGNWTVGLVGSQKTNAFRKGAFNKITIRKIGNLYHFYINETYYDVLQYETFYGNQFAFYIGPRTEMHVDWLRISELQ